MTRPPIKRRSEECAMRNAKILEWMREGCSVERISQKLAGAGYARISRSRLLRIVASLRQTPTTADAFRAAELARLAELESALHAKALRGDNAAVDRVLAIIDRRAKLLGLSATQAAPDNGEAERVKQALLQKLSAMAARIKGEAAVGQIAATAPKPR
jgi:hypothetical protein